MSGLDYILLYVGFQVMMMTTTKADQGKSMLFPDKEDLYIPLSARALDAIDCSKFSYTEKKKWEKSLSSSKVLSTSAHLPVIASLDAS